MSIITQCQIFASSDRTSTLKPSILHKLMAEQAMTRNLENKLLIEHAHPVC